MSKIIVYLDLDGCFADFDKKLDEVGLYKRHEDRWRVLESIPNLFYKLDLMPKAKPAYQVIEWLCKYHEAELEFLTALPLPTGHFHTSAEDKTRWVREFLESNKPVNTPVGWHGKLRWVSPNAILIDNMMRNIEAWTDKGGVGILHEGDWSTTLANLTLALDFMRQEEKY